MMGAGPVERGTWLFLLAWCATQENDGCIKDCLLWKDRRWQQTCGVTKNEVHMDSDLYCFVGDDLVVNLYPLDKQNEVQRKRDQAKKNGRMGGRPKKTPPSETIEESTPKPTLVPTLKSGRRRRRVKGRRMEGVILSLTRRNRHSLTCGTTHPLKLETDRAKRRFPRHGRKSKPQTAHAASNSSKRLKRGA